MTTTDIASTCRRCGERILWDADDQVWEHDLVPAPGAEHGPDPTQTIAERLSPIVDRLDGYDVDIVHAALTMQAVPGDTEAVDVFAKALFGVPGQPVQMDSGHWHHTARGALDGIDVTVFCVAAEPVEEKRKRLEAELAALDAQVEVR